MRAEIARPGIGQVLVARPPLRIGCPIRQWGNRTAPLGVIVVGHVWRTRRRTAPAPEKAAHVLRRYVSDGETLAQYQLEEAFA